MFVTGETVRERLLTADTVEDLVWAMQVLGCRALEYDAHVSEDVVVVLDRATDWVNANSADADTVWDLLGPVWLDDMCVLASTTWLVRRSTRVFSALALFCECVSVFTDRGRWCAMPGVKAAWDVFQAVRVCGGAAMPSFPYEEAEEVALAVTSSMIPTASPVGKPKPFMQLKVVVS